MNEDDEAAFVAFAQGVTPRMLRTAWLLCGDAARAEDAVQESLVRLYGVWTRVRADQPEAYLHRILRNHLVSTWRRERRQVLVPEVRDGGREDPDTATQRMDLVRALRQLPRREREVVVLRHYADLSEQAVADLLGVSTGTVKSSASRGLQRLREAVREKGASRAQ